MFPTFEGRGAFKDPVHEYILSRQSKQKHIHAQTVQAQPLQSHWWHKLRTQLVQQHLPTMHPAQRAKLEVKIAAKHRETYGLTHTLHVKLVKCI